MTIDEWRKLMLDSKLYNEQFNDRDGVLAFNYSMQTQVDEINSDKNLQMHYIEFIEALSRAADILNFIPHEKKEGHDELELEYLK